jgi:flagellar motility protein MotE (MotC chaperone)
MIRTLGKILACVCIAFVLAEGGAVIVMWRRGLLTNHNLREIRMVLSAGPQEETAEAESAKQSSQPTLAQVTQERAGRLFDFDKRESQLRAMRTMADDQSAELEVRLREFRAHKKSFEDGLAVLQKNVSSQATEQARGILLALPPRDAVEKLMNLPLAENLQLLKGMPDKSIARILAEFNASPEQLDRSRKIFEGISRGDPARSFINEETRKSVAEVKPAEERK